MAGEQPLIDTNFHEWEPGRSIPHGPDDSGPLPVRDRMRSQTCLRPHATPRRQVSTNVPTCGMRPVHDFDSPSLMWCDFIARSRISQFPVSRHHLGVFVLNSPLTVMRSTPEQDKSKKTCRGQHARAASRIDGCTEANSFADGHSAVRESAPDHRGRTACPTRLPFVGIRVHSWFVPSFDTVTRNQWQSRSGNHCTRNPYATKA